MFAPQFGGNFLDDFTTDSFVAGPETPTTAYNTPNDTTTRIFLDREARLNLRFTGNVGQSIGSVTEASQSNRIVNGVLKNGRYFVPDALQTPPVVTQKQVGNLGRVVADFQVEDTPTPVGSVLNGTNFFSDPDSTFPRNVFINEGYTIVPIGSLFP